MDISLRIKSLMAGKKITQNELSEKIGMSLIGLNKALKNNDFKMSVLQKIADALEVDIKYFFGEKITKQNESEYISYIKKLFEDIDNTYGLDVNNFIREKAHNFMNLRSIRQNYAMLVGNIITRYNIKESLVITSNTMHLDFNKGGQFGYVEINYIAFLINTLPRKLISNDIKEYISIKNEYYHWLNGLDSKISADVRLLVSQLEKLILIQPDLQNYVRSLNGESVIIDFEFARMINLEAAFVNENCSYYGIRYWLDNIYPNIK